MNNYSAEILWYSFLLSFDSSDYQLLNNRGYLKTINAVKDGDRDLLESGICDIELALKCFVSFHPSKVYDVGLGNLQTAKDLRLHIAIK